MKHLSASVLCLLITSLTFGHCVEISPVNSSKNVRIIAMMDGQTLQTVKVKVVEAGKSPIASLVTDDHGVAVLPILKPGFYSIVAAAGDDLGSSLDLHVLNDVETTLSTFSMNLSPSAAVQMLPAAATKPVSSRIQEFKGIVLDQSGAAIPGATIKVFARGAEEKTKRVQLTADESGQFSSPLPNGIYTVVVEAQGFRPEFVVFEMARNGEAKELQVSLRVGGC